MTDYSGWTDEQVNEVIAIKKGWRHHAYIDEDGGHDDWITPAGRPSIFGRHPDYTHDWGLCGGLLEEMKADDPGVFYMDEGTNSKYWRAQVNILWRDADTPQRAICEAWLAWKEQG